MSRQRPPSARVSWEQRPVTVRDMAVMVAVIIFACGAAFALSLFTLRNQPQSGPGEQPAVGAPPAAAAADAGAIAQTAAQPSGSGAAGKATFEKQCTPCHSIGGGVVVGPDLAAVTERRDEAWLARWISGPDKMLAAGDPTATSLLEEYNNVAMPNLELSPAQVDDLIAFLRNPEGSGPATAAPTLPAGDAARGKELFTGALALQSGGPACMSCHTTANAGPLGGGTLGPDLTHVYQRYGEAGLPTTLQNLPFPTMQGIFGNKPLADQEAADLYAYFVQTDQATTAGRDATFVVIGLVAFALLILSSQLIWRKRLKAVRKPLLGGA